MLFQFGKFITTNKFRHAVPEPIKKFYTISYKEIIDSGYNAWVSGSCVYHQPVTGRDLDLYLIGQVKDIQALEDLMHRLYENAVDECGFLLDCKWLSTIDLYPTNTINDNGVASVNPVEFIEIGYMKYDIPEHKIFKEYFFDQRRNAVKISEWLVKGRFGDAYRPKRPEINYFRKHGKMPILTMEEYIKSLD